LTERGKSGGAQQERLLVVDLAARAKNWALSPAGERTILDAAPTNWRVHVVRELTSSDGDGPREPSRESIDAISNAEVYFGFGIPKPLFLAGKRLRWVHSAAAGVGNALFPEMLASDVMLTNSAGVHAIPIAEYVVAGILHFFRGLDVAAEQQREHKWDKQFFTSNDTPVREIGGARVLIVGAGGIGREVAKRLTALGAECVGIRRHLQQRTQAVPGFVRMISLRDIDAELPHVDVIVLAIPLTRQTTGVINAKRLNALNPAAVLVNVSRGQLVDESALADALRAGRLRGAVLDVFREEPLTSTSPFWDLRNALLTPHISPVSPGRFWPRALELFTENWRRYERGEPLRNLVDKRAGY
jgi:phosphoglycerate dehydrogenase-like enzyme